MMSSYLFLLIKEPEFGDKLVRERCVFDVFEDFVFDLFVDKISHFESKFLNLSDQFTFYLGESNASKPK
jgi:hypothetical protein